MILREDEQRTVRATHVHAPVLLGLSLRLVVRQYRGTNVTGRWRSLSDLQVDCHCREGRRVGTRGGLLNRSITQLGAHLVRIDTSVSNRVAVILSVSLPRSAPSGASFRSSRAVTGSSSTLSPSR